MSTIDVDRGSLVDVDAALGRARRALLDQQHADGWWKGELQTNVTMDAEDLLLREFLGIRDPQVTAASAAWIRSQQRADGTWATFHEGPGDLSTTIEAYVALRLAGDEPGAEHMTAAAAFVRGSGGLERSRVFTRLWLALFGEWSWDDLPALIPELVLLPAWLPWSIYDFACWARQTVVAVTVVGVYRPVQLLPFGLDELRSGLRPLPAPEWSTPQGRWYRLDHLLLRRYHRAPWSWLRRRALARAERWIVERQEADGSWGGIQPPWVYSLLALHLRGYALEHPVVRAGLDGLDGFTVRDRITDDGIDGASPDDGGNDESRNGIGTMRRLEACQSPVWDTALAMIALADAGVDPADPALVRGAEWLLDHEVTTRGDWSVRRPDLAPGGWAFEFANEHYPDIDDTAEVVLALRRVRHPDPGRVDAAIGRAVDWVRGMRCRDGAWGAFDADNTRLWPRQLPFCDFGEVVDPPTADVTAHVLEMLAVERVATTDDRAIEWLGAAQEPGGSWWGRWGVNHVYGTGAALPALRAAGVPTDDLRMRRAVRFLEAHQNDDGGWGEDLRSYVDDDWVGRGTSTASQTAWALLALLAAGERCSDVTRRGIEWLVEGQRADGTWDEPWFTGTGFPWDFSINYHLYRQVFPVMALGRYAGLDIGVPVPAETDSQ